MLVLLGQYCVAMIFTASTLCMSRGRFRLHPSRFVDIPFTAHDHIHSVHYYERPGKAYQENVDIKLSSACIYFNFYHSPSLTRQTSRR